jgi:membrane fusion protein
MSDLFRPEAISHQAKGLQGEVIVGTRLPWLLLGYILSGFLFALLAVIVFAQYSRKESVSGVLIPQAGIIRIAATQGGLITNVAASEGQSLAAGAPVAELRLAVDMLSGNTGKALEAAVLNEQAAARNTGIAQIEKVRADHARLIQRRAAIQAQYQEGLTARGILVEKQKLAERNLSRARDLSQKGFLSARGLDDAQAAAIDAQQDISNADAALLSLKMQLTEVDAQLGEIPILLDQARSQAQSQDAGMTQKLQQVRSSSTYAVTSPIDGIVVAVPSRVGQTAQPGSTLAILTPRNSPLEAELYVPSRAFGFVRPGQDVSLQYEAFSYKKFGAGNGRVVAVSQTPLTPAEAAISGVAANEPVFKVRVALEKDYVMAYGQRAKLRPGMLLNADIIVERRSIVDWLLDPLYAVGKR